jgi:hypothetical protein
LCVQDKGFVIDYKKQLHMYVSLRTFTSTSYATTTTSKNIFSRLGMPSFLRWFFVLTMFVGAGANAQTTLISPTGDGGFASGATFAANGWSVSNSANNPWVLGNVVSTAPFSGLSAYISNDGGVTNAYTPANEATNYFYRDVTVPAGETSITLSLNWRGQGESIWDLWQVFTAPTTVVPAAVAAHPGSGTGTVPPGIAGATFVGYGNLSGTVQTATFTLNPALAGTTFRLIFSWKNETGGTQPPAAIDNISLISRLPIPANAAPTTFTATAIGVTTTTVGWKDNSTNETSFRVYRSVDNINFTVAGNVNSTTTGGVNTTYSLAQTGLTPNTLYYYRVYAVFEAESLTFLTGSQATPVPVPADAPPINFTTSLITSATMKIGWTDNSTNETSFRVYRSTDNINFSLASTVTSTTGSATGTAYSANQTGLNPSTTYYFRVFAVFESESAEFLTGTETTIPAIAATCAISYTPFSGTTNVSFLPQVLSWPAVVAEPVATYDVYFSTDQALVTAQNSSARVLTSTSSLSYTTPTLAISTTYYWKVVPKNSAGVPTDCPVNSFTTIPPSVPFCVTSVTPSSGAINVNPTTLTSLSWSGAIGIPAITGYDVYVSSTFGLVSTLNPAAKVVSNTSATSFTPSYLTTVFAPGTTYYWVVVPINSIGASAGCNVNSFTTISPVAITSTPKGGLWNSAATWVGGVIPVSTDNVTIADGSVVTVDVAVTVNNLTIGQGGSGTSILQWNSSTNGITIPGNLIVASNGKFLPYSTGGSGVTINIGGNFTNNGYANCTLSTLNFNGSQAGGGSSSQSLNGTGTFLGTGTKGIIRSLSFQTSGTVTIGTTQTLITSSLLHAAGALNTGGKLSIDNTAQVYGQSFNREVASVAVTNMGSGYTTAPAIGPASSANWATGAIALGAIRINGTNVYVATVAGSATAGNAPTQTSGTSVNGTLTWLWIGNTGTIGNAIFGTTNLTPAAGTQYFYGTKLFTCSVSGAITAAQAAGAVANLNAATPGTSVVIGLSTFICAGTAAQVTVNHDVATGTLRSLNLTSAGSGYLTAAPSLVVSNTGAGSSAAATATFFQQIIGIAAGSTQKTPAAVISGSIDIKSDQSVGALSTTNGGIGYTAVPFVGFPLPTAFKNLVTASGSGYTSVPTVAVSGGTKLTGATDPAFTVVVAQGKVISVICTGGGTLWTGEPTLTLTGGGGSGATAAFASGSLATATAVLTNGTVTDFTIITGGQGYPSAPTPVLVTNTAGTVITAASALSSRVGLYNLTYNFLTPATNNPEGITGTEIPLNHRINILTLGSTSSASNSAKVKLATDVELYDASGALKFQTGTSYGSVLNLNGKTLNCSHPAYPGMGTVGSPTQAAFGYATNGFLKLSTPGGSLTRTFPFDAPFAVNTGSAADATLGSTITSITVSQTAPPTSSGPKFPIGKRAYNAVVNTGAVYGTNPTVSLTYNLNDSLPSSLTQPFLFVGQSDALTGAWTTRSTATGTGLLPVPTGSRTTATAVPGPIVPGATGNDYFAWISESPAPTISGSYGPFCSAGGTTVVITGTGFSNVTNVRFNGVNAASFVVNSVTSISAVTPSGITAGAISVTANGTTATSSNYAVTVTPLFAPTVIPSNGLVCSAGGSVSISIAEVGADSYTWTGGPGLDTYTGLNVVASPLTTTTYTVTGNIAGCTVSQAFMVGVVPGATIVPTASPASSCFNTGATVTLNSNLSAGNFAVTAIPYAAEVAPANATALVSPGGIANPNFVLGNASLDDGGWQGIPIGFNFNFFGNNFNTIAAGTNGLLMFGPVPGFGTQTVAAGQLGQYVFTSTNGVVFPNAVNPGNVIALLAGDLIEATCGSIKFWNVGVAPTRKFIIEYAGVANYNSCSALNTVQGILYETTGIVEIHVLNVTGSAKTIGLQDATKTIGACPPGRQGFSNSITTPEAWRFSPPTNYSFDWSPATNLNNTTGGSVTYTPTSAGIKNVTLKVTNPVTGCEISKPLSFTVNATPTAPTITGTLSVCGSGSTALFSSAPGSGNVIKWYNAPVAGTLLNTGTLFVTPVITITTTYYVAEQNAFCSSVRTPVTVTINTPPLFRVNDPVLCPGTTSTQLNVTSSVSDYDTYTWSPITNLYQDAALTVQYTGQNLTTVYVKNPAPGKTQYICTANSFATLCSSKDTSIITVQPAVATITSNNTSVCVSTAVVLSLASATPIAAGSVQWQSSSDGINFTDIPGATGINDTTGAITSLSYYRVNIKDGTGAICYTTPTYLLSGLAPVLTTNKTVCNDAVATLSVTSNTSDYDSYSWTPIDNLFTDAAATIPYVAGANATTVFSKTATAGSTTYTVHAANSVTTCTSTATSVVTVLPAEVTIASSPATICITGSATLSLVPSSGYGAAAFQWQSSSDGVTFTNIASATAATLNTGTVTATTYYQALIKDATGAVCTTTAPYMLKVLTAATSVALTSNQTVCNNSIATLTASSPDYNKYTWSPVTRLFTDAAATIPYVAGTNAATVYARSTTAGTTTYTLTATSNTVCAATGTVVVTILPAAVTIASSPSAICGTGSATLSLSPSSNYGDAGFQWQSSADGITFTDIAGATTNTLATGTLTSTTSYQAVIKDGTGATCTITPVYQLTVNNPQVTGTTPAGLCGRGSVTLSATGSAGSILKWYASVTSDTVLFTGNSFITPIINTTTTYYVEASIGSCKSSTRTAVVATSGTTSPITLSPSVTVCANAIVALSVTSNIPDYDSYKWSPATNLYRDPSATIPYVAGSSATAVYAKISDTGNHIYTVDARNTNTLCGAADSTNVRIVPGTPVTIAGPKTLCNNAVGTLSITSPAANYDTYTWTPVTNLFTDAAATTPYVAGTNATTVYVKRTTPGSIIYTVNAANNINSCATVSKDTVNVQPASGNVISTPATICNSGTAVLSLTPASGYANKFIQWQTSADNIAAYTAISGAINTTYTTPTVTSSSWYKALIKNGAGATCFTAGPYQLVYNSPSVTVISTNITRCGAGSVTLTATGSAGTTVNWYDESTGGVLLGTGTSFVTPEVTSTTSFYVSATINGCESPRTEVAVTVSTPPTLTVTDPQIVCNNTITAFTVTSTLSDYETYKWSPAINLYTDAAATIPYVAGTSAITVYAKTAVAGTTIYVVSASNTGTDCSLNKATSLTVQPGAATISSSPTTLCLNGSALLSLAPASPYSIGTIQWQRSFDNINFIDIPAAIGTTLNTPTQATTRYYRAQIKNGIGDVCFATAPYTLVVNNPVVTGTTAGSSCGIQTVTLGATASAGATLSWYANPTGGSSLGTGSTFITPVISATTNYYVEASIGGCVSGRTMVTASITPPPALTLSPAQFACNSSVAALSVTSTLSDFNTYTWSPVTNLYMDAAATVAYVAGTSASTVYYKRTTAGASTYTVTATNTASQCVNTATTTVTSVLVAFTTAANPASICFGNPSVLTATGPAAYTYQWNPGGLTGNPVTVIPAATGTATYTATATEPVSGCTNTVNVDVIVLELPAAPTAANSTQCGYGVPSAFVVTGFTGGSSGAYKWYSAATGGTLLQTGGSTYASPINATTIFYVSESNGICESERTAVTATVGQPDLVHAAADLGSVCMNSAVSLSATKEDGLNVYTYSWSASPAAGSGITGSLPGANVTVTPTVAGTYVYTVTAVDGACTTIASITVTVKALPAVALTADPATVCAGSTVTLNGTSTTVAAGIATIGTGTVLNETNLTTNMPPYGNYYTGNRHQMLVKAADLVASGMHAGNITSLAFDVVSNTNALGYKNFGIALKNTTTNALTTTFESGATEVYTNANFNPVAGWSTHNFATPFVWDGTSNVLVETYFSNCTNCTGGTSCGTTGSGVSYTQNAVVRQRTTSYVSHAYYYADAEGCNPQTVGTASTSNSTMPNMQFGAQIQTVATGLDWQWNPGSLSGSTVTVNPTTNTTYIATVTDPATTCSNTGSITVNVNPIPNTPSGNGSEQCGTQIPTASVSSNNGTGTHTFNWYANATGGTPVQTGVYTTYQGNVAVTTTFYVSEIGASGCESGRTPVVITVTPPDPIAPAATATSYCLGNSITLSANHTGDNNSYGYTWTAFPAAGSGIPSSETGDGITVTPTVAGTYVYTLTATDPDRECSNVQTVTVTMIALPQITSITTTAPAICAGNGVTLNATTTTIVAGTATIGTGTVTNSISNFPTPYGQFYGSTHEQYLVRASELAAAGITAGNITSIAWELNSGYTYNPLQNFKVSLAHTALAEMTATIVGSGFTTVVPSGTYTPPNAAGFAAINFATPFAWNGTSNVIVDVSFSNCSVCNGTTSCTTSFTNNGVVKQTPTAFVSTLDFHADGNCTINSFSPSTTGNIYSQRPNMKFGAQLIDIGSGGLNWSWNPGALSGNSVLVTPAITTVYSVTATNPGTGCVSTSAPLTVTVNPLPNAPIASNAAQCGEGMPTASVTTGGANGTFKWYSAQTGGTLLQTGGSTYATSISGTTHFWVAEDNGTCESLRTEVIVTVTDPNPVDATVNLHSVCPNANIRLDVANTAVSPVNNYTYTWTAFPAAGSGIPGSMTGATLSVTPTAAGTYVYTATAYDAVLGCTTHDTVHVTVNPNPVLDNVTANAATICSGATSTLNVYSSVITSGPQTPPAGYLSSNATNTSDEDILNVTFGTLNNSSTCTTTGGGASVVNEYSDFTALTPPTVVAGSTIPLSVQVGTCDGNFGNWTNVFIDYNRNGAFEAAERVYTSSASTTGAHLETGNITIPSTVSAGVALMRVIVVEFGTNTQSPTGTYSWGETEDYLVNLQSIVTQNPAYNYSWTPGSLTGATVSVTPTISTTYNAIATNPVTGCVSAPLPVTVTVTPVGATAAAVPGTSCSGSAVGLNVTATGVGPFTYSWSDGTTVIGTTQSLTVNPTATTTYTVTVKDACLNPATSSVIVNVNPLPTAAVAEAGPLAICSGFTQVFTAVTNAAAPAYQWTLNGSNISGANGATYTANASGSYAVKITETATGCNATSAAVTLTVNPLPAPVVITPASPAICAGNSVTINGVSIESGNRTIGSQTTTLVNDGNPYRTGNGVGNQIKTQLLLKGSELSALGFIAGNITSLGFTTTSTTGALANFSIRLAHTTATALTSTYETPSLTTVFSQPSFTPAAGLNTHVFSTPFTWDGTSNIIVQVCQENATLGTSTVAAYDPGYTANVHTANSIASCTAATGTTVASRPLITLGANVSSPITWAPPAGLNTTTGSTVIASPASTTTYTATATNLFGCIRTNTVTVTVNPLPTVSFTVLNATYCSNAATVTLTGNHAPAGTFTGAGITDNGNGTATFDPNAAGAGAHSITYAYTDPATTCSATSSQSVNVVAAPVAAITYTGTPYCSSAEFANVTQTGVTGGTYSGPAGLFISPATGQVNLGSSTPGTYTVTYSVTANGCTTLATASIMITPAPFATIAYSATPYCKTGSVATATVTHTGSTGGIYTAAPAGLTLNAATGAVTLASSAPGVYTITYTIPAANGCATFVTSTGITVTNCTSIVTDPAIGGMDITNMGGTSQSSNTLLFTQNYILTLPVYNFSQSDALPTGATTLTIDLGTKMIVDPAFNLATAPLSSYYAWSVNTVAGHQVITGTQIMPIPADYNDVAAFTVKGTTSCTSTITAHISQYVNDEDPSNNNANMQYTFAVTVSATPTNITCNGASNGTITVVSSPGTTLSIKNASNVIVSTSAVTTNLAPGVYIVTASATGDAPLNNTCSNTTTVTIMEPDVLAGTPAGTPVSCFGGSNGTATANASGGNAPYSYVWNTVPAQTGPTAIGLAAGIYIVNITDVNGCTATATYTVGGPSAPVSVGTSGTAVSCYQGANGTATAIATGGTAGYTYTWNTVPAQTGATASNLAAGTYIVTATDANGCSATAMYTVTQPTTPLAGSLSGTTNNICHGGTSGSISITAAGGTAGYAFTIAGPTVNTTGAATGTFTGLSAGSYNITVTDANGCTRIVPATITEPSGINADLSLGADYTANFFAANGVEHTIMYNVSEIGGNPAVGDTIRLTKVAGYDFTFDNTLTTTTISFVPYTLNNTQWKIDNSNPAFVSLIKIDPINPLNPGTINCGQLVRVAIKMKRNTPNISTFTLSARLRKANNEVNLANNLNSIVFTAE